MKRITKVLSTSFALLIAVTFPALTNDEHHTPNQKFNSIKITDQITLLQGMGGNLALLSGSDGLLLVDDDYKELSEALKSEIDNRGGLDKLTYIINTHWHADHTQGNLALGEHAAIVAHDNVRVRLLSKGEIKLFNVKTEAYPKVALPSLTYDKQMSLHFNNEEVRLVHFANGHTDGDSVVFFKYANVVHMGDHYFNGFFPFVDIDSGGNVVGYTNNIKAILAMIDDNTKVIPGHGALSNKQELQNFYNMLVGTTAEVRVMKNKGLALEDIQKIGLSVKWQPWTKGFLTSDVWIKIIFASL
jgi:glyoxylase-like metal-dependent hydrolase (beta-lactamase superfamily II)